MSPHQCRAGERMRHTADELRFSVPALCSEHKDALARSAGKQIYDRRPLGFVAVRDVRAEVVERQRPTDGRRLDVVQLESLGHPGDQLLEFGTGGERLVALPSAQAYWDAILRQRVEKSKTDARLFHFSS